MISIKIFLSAWREVPNGRVKDQVLGSVLFNNFI